MSSKLERWLEWACSESVRILVRNMIGSKKLKMAVVLEPAEGRPVNGSLFVAWWRGEKLRASAWNGSLAELVARSSEGDAQHGPLLPGEVDKLQISVGVVRRGGGEGKQVLLFAEHLRFVGVEETGMLSDDEQDEENSETAGTVVAMQTVMLGGAGQEQQQAEKESKGSRSWIKWVLVVLFAALLLYMRYNDATYDVKWEVFYSHYAVLGLKEGASMKEAKVAYHKLSLSSHPDKLGDKCDDACQERFQRVTDAYAAIRDFHSGRLRIVDKPTRFDE